MSNKFEDLMAAKLEAKEQEDRAARETFREVLRLEAEEFYNTCHSPDTGTFCEGPDGPGRVRDNLKKAEAVLGKKAPTALKNLLTRRLGRANKTAQKTLPKTAAQYQKDLAKRVAEKRTIAGEN